MLTLDLSVYGSQSSRQWSNAWSFSMSHIVFLSTFPQALKSRCRELRAQNTRISNEQITAREFMFALVISIRAKEAFTLEAQCTSEWLYQDIHLTWSHYKERAANGFYAWRPTFTFVLGRWSAVDRKQSSRLGVLVTLLYVSGSLDPASEPPCLSMSSACGNYSPMPPIPKTTTWWD